MEDNTNVMFRPKIDERPNYIKVVGVGGGGGNAVNYMYAKGIQGVDFVLCNTDSQALNKSGIATKVHLGQHDLGAGNNPDFGREAAESEVSINELNHIIDSDVTKMVFITAGMGGGTGTGAAPVVAKIAKEKGILTVGIVTKPFECEGRRRKQQADKGIKELSDNVDALIVISNDKLREEYGNMILTEAFHKADEVLMTAAKGIAEIITVPGYINVDFRDVDTVMRNSGKAIMGMGIAKGENRAEEALEMALSSPLLDDNDITGAKNLLIRITSAPGENEIRLDEATNIIELAQDRCGNISDVIWGTGVDETLGDSISITVIATGFGGNKKSTETTNNNLNEIKLNETTSAISKKIHNLETIKHNNIKTETETKNEENELFPEITKIKTNNTVTQDNTTDITENDITQEILPDDKDIAEVEIPQTEPNTIETTPTIPNNEHHIVHTLDDFFNDKDDEKNENLDAEEPTNMTNTRVHVLELNDTPDEHSTTTSWQKNNTPQQDTVVKKFDNAFGNNENNNDFELQNMGQNNTQAISTIEKVEVKVEKITTETKTDPRIEQRNKLKSLSQFNFNDNRELSLLETVPAYMRHNKNLDIAQGDDEMSKYSSNQEGNFSKNSYLHNNVD